MYGTKSSIRQREYGRMHPIYKGEEGIKAPEHPREAEVKI